MRWQWVAAAALIAAGAGPARAQVSPYRRFTQNDVMDTNRNNRIVYLPVVMGVGFSGPRPGSQGYDVAAASWYLQPLGNPAARPDKVLDKGTYTLETFEAFRPAGAKDAQIRVVVTRRPAPPEGAAPPEIHLVDPRSYITARGPATVETLPDGVRYTATITPPAFGFDVREAAGRLASDNRFQVLLMSARDVKLPRAIARAPTFGGAEQWETLSRSGPQLPLVERVAGKRIEYRSGQVIEESKDRKK